MCIIKRLLPVLTIIFLFIRPFTYSQSEVNLVDGRPVEFDKCGYHFNDELNFYETSTNNWGYSYDSLLADLEIWKMSAYVKVDSIGLSVQGRPLWRLTISEDPNNVTGKRTVHVHARTHPQETEGHWVTKEMINILLSEIDYAQTIREACVYYIIPMFNPDGVELNLPRRNANNVDLESNWNTFPHQPEVSALKAHFISLMSSPNPIEVMLNMHSASLCKRYFVYHDSVGTSPAFAYMQQDFISGIRSYYSTGIEPWNYYISWTSGTPLQYPESWFWITHGENVMALTYEDMYQCPLTGNFDITAKALVRGVMDYMGIVTDVDYNIVESPGDFELYQNYPNPFNPGTVISYQLMVNSFVSIKVFDVLGNEVAALVNEEKPAGVHQVSFNANILSSGVYFYTINAGNNSQTRKMIYQK
jgi:hypothetical protein